MAPPLKGEDGPGLFCPFQEGSILDVPAGQSNPAVGIGGVAGSVSSRLRPEGTFLFHVGELAVLGCILVCLQQLSHEEAAGWAWDVKLLICYYLKFQSQTLVGRNLVGQ